MKISIVIPSRERASYLKHSLATVTAIKDANLEVVVSDNASTDNTQSVVAANGDSRVRYVNTGQRVSMRQNFEFGLRNSTGDYVTMFGDDDGIMPGQFARLRRILESTRPDALSWDFPTYGWPVGDVGSKAGGVRLSRKNSFGSPFSYDAKVRLRALEQGHSDMTQPLPVLYHGCMSRAYLERLAAPAGDYFKSMSPDLYISFRALQHGGKFWHINHPFSINGFSPASTGGSMASLGGANEKNADLRFISEVKIDETKDVIPLTKSMSLAFLGTLQTVAQRHPEIDIKPDYMRWYRLCLIDQSKKDPATAAEIGISLQRHADQFGTHAELEMAQKNGLPTAMEKAQIAWVRNISKLRSFRRLALIDGENTIETAARMCDTIVGDDLGAVLDGQTTAPSAWANARRRSGAFGKQI
jgi:glycosyltransferase involved in cell wall biosynthesis